jgi:hypothetical protein
VGSLDRAGAGRAAGTQTAQGRGWWTRARGADVNESRRAPTVGGDVAALSSEGDGAGAASQGRQQASQGRSMPVEEY